ncbi:hypothetical protein B0H67DRAFT_681546 [Lasiosphaeris hirsuta]|uniref:Uncharacterized protein n=1 Tax=Lasiosphaeris hirsuta TaxID=260670 RepID=A0AA40AP80_9PEZI|nr:hypothetical protein B0H67DRAFT_681546 [Lasiosphaeris hirsuta]
MGSNDGPAEGHNEGHNEGSNAYPAAAEPQLERLIAKPTSQDLKLDLPPRAGITRRVLSLAIYLGWFAIIVALLVLNAMRHIVGPSFACLVEECLVFPGGTSRKAMDLADRNFAGAMQLVAKFLELWFLYIACSLVYNICLLLAGRLDGLPLQYLLLFENVLDPQTFLHPSFWRAPFSRSRHAAMASSKQRRALYFFLPFVLVLCLLANLMGPAAAILLLPTQESATVASIRPKQFLRFNSEAPPNLTKYHRDDPLADDMYYTGIISARIPFSFTRARLDQGIAASLARSYYWGVIPFGWDYSTVNVDQLDMFQYGIAWIPSSQVLLNVEIDVRRYYYSVEPEGYPLDHLTDLEPFSASLRASFRDSVNIAIHRRGPAVGLSSGCFAGNVSIIVVAQDKHVRCYITYFDVNGTYTYSDIDRKLVTRCIRVGSGWTNEKNGYAQFSVNLTDTNTTGVSLQDGFETASVNIYSAASAIFLNTTTNPSPLNQQIVEYIYPVTHTAPFPDPGYYEVTYCVSFAYLGFGNYTQAPKGHHVDPLGFSVDNHPEETTDPIYIDPGWVLATWLVDNGTTVHGNLDLENLSVFYLLRSLRSLIHFDYSGNLTQTLDNIQAVHFCIMANTVTLIDYDETSDLSSVANTTSNPILETTVSADVWRYGLSSRTSKLGFAVALAGCIVVCANIILCLSSWHTTKPGLVELIQQLLRAQGSQGEAMQGGSNSMPVKEIWVTLGPRDTDVSSAVQATDKTASDED